MAASQPFSVPLAGGLNKSTNSFDLLKNPGIATKLRNFESAIEGGYRRINGYSQFGDGTRPNSSNDILGLHVYADGLIACSGTNIYLSLDGDSWLQINRDSVAGGGDNYSTFTGRSALARTSQSTAHLVTYDGDSTYGEVIITDEGSGVKPMYFKMTGSGALSNRTYFCKEITVSGGQEAARNYPPTENPGDMFAQKEVEDLLPASFASRNQELKARMQGHANWAKQDRFNNTFVHFQSNTVTDGNNTYRIAMSQHYNGNYEGFKNPRFTEIRVKELDNESDMEKDLGKYVVDTTALMQDLRKLETIERIS